MKIAEGLARRRDLTNAIQKEFVDGASDSILYEEGSKAPNKDVFGELKVWLNEVHDLSVQINLANNINWIKYDGQSITLMAAIALRDVYSREAAAINALLEHIQSATGRGRHAYYNRRQKDDVRTLSSIPLSEIRKNLDTVQGNLRRLDMEIQKANWALDLPR